jgi:ATP-dependent Clp protease adapter protein ClpS
MKLILIGNFGETEEVVSEKASLYEVISLVDALNWQHFHQVVLQKDTENWIEVGESLKTHGLAAVICHDNEHFVMR